MKYLVSLLSNNRFIISLAIIIFITGTIHSLISHNFIWFSRIGSLLVGLGIVSISRTYIIRQDLLLYIMDKGMNMNSPEYFKLQNQPIPDYINTNEQSKRAIGTIGPIISFVGTIIWGYGELLNKLYFI